MIRRGNNETLIEQLAHVRVIIALLHHDHFVFQTFLALRLLPLLLKHEQTRVIFLSTLLLLIVAMLVMSIILRYEQLQVVFDFFFVSIV
jgi:hypothetical protein